tara:strand:+ start:3257 stop:3547 length:291 start_codon:yes stop_codon:yes gene_type:complete
MREYNSLEMLIGEDITTEKKKVYYRDRYGSKERKRNDLEIERNLRKLEEKNLKELDRKNMLYNKWFDLTETKFWQKYVKQNVTYYGIYTKFKKQKI